MIADYFEEIFPRLVGYATRQRCRDPEGFASEAITLSLAAEAAGKMIEPSYIYRTVHNLIVSDIRRTSGIAMVPLDAMVGGLPDPSSIDLVEQLATASEAERILAAMTPLQADVLRLRADGYQFKDVATITGRSENAAKKIHAYGLASARMKTQHKGRHT